MGATIFGNSFSARASFLKYTVETETKFTLHNAVRPGRCVLVFCGTGFSWHKSELEDFADFYARGQHAADDPFAAMERHSMEKKKIQLTRKLDGFAVVFRGRLSNERFKWIFPVRGPTWPMRYPVRSAYESS
jgi:hypothetical protein